MCPRIFVKAKMIKEEEARQVRQKLLQEVKELLMKVIKGISEVISGDEDTYLDQIILDNLTKTKNQVENLHEEINKITDTTLIMSDFDKVMTLILERIKDLRSIDHLKESLIIPETNAIIAYSNIRWIADAESIIKEPEKARDDKATFSSERKRIAHEFEIRFPTFLGCSLDYEYSPMGVTIWLTCSSPKQEADKVYIAFWSILEEILKWELRKMWFSMIAIPGFFSQRMGENFGGVERGVLILRISDYDEDTHGPMPK
ncbi:MAG: hypothetical protein HWN67_07750 [Candidatus Helarchaeota archaeon]|nr:hypothetical protein [Candidatus Helarchaeota archaeon]